MTTKTKNGGVVALRAPRTLLSLLLLPGLLAGAAQARSAEDAYTSIKPVQPTQSPDKIEMVEVFWYGCSHCYRFEPHLEKWRKNLPEDVVFRRVPGVLNKDWIPHARAYFAAEKMGVVDKMHTPLFKALHVSKRRLYTRKSLIGFVNKLGLDGDEFAKHYDSNETDVKMKQAFLLARNAKITGVPSMIVNGKYLVSASSAGSFKRMIETMDYLADLERRR